LETRLAAKSGEQVFDWDFDHQSRPQFPATKEPRSSAITFCRERRGGAEIPRAGVSRELKVSTEVALELRQPRIRSFYRRMTSLLNRLRADSSHARPTAPVLFVDSPGSHPIEPGIASIRGWACTADSRFPEGIVEIALDDDEEWVELPWRIPVAGHDPADGWSGRCGFRAALNTFLVGNGVHRLRLRLKTRAGRVSATKEVTFRVNHAGPLAEKTARLLRAHPKAKRIWSGAIDSDDFPYSEARDVAWFERATALDHVAEIVERHQLPAAYEGHLRHFITEGYIVLEDFIPKEHCDQINRDLDTMIDSGAYRYAFKGQRIEKLFERSRSTRELWAHPQILKILSAVFDDVALPCQTLNFIHGSQQDVHQDVIHLTPFPAGMMCGVWVALEDIHPDSGPLVVYPGSHRLPRLYTRTAGVDKVLDGDWDRFAGDYTPKIKDLVDRSGLRPSYYTPKVGSVLIWHENLAHGGSPRKNENLTRRSIVSHYFAQGGMAYYDSQGTPAWTKPDPD
jgi:hypothetical protein